MKKQPEKTTTPTTAIKPGERPREPRVLSIKSSIKAGGFNDDPHGCF